VDWRVEFGHLITSRAGTAALRLADGLPAGVGSPAEYTTKEGKHSVCEPSCSVHPQLAGPATGPTLAGRATCV
jgi:hypothetical protein